MNALFIGLGGAGCSAVAEYARMIQSSGIDTNDAFLYFDTEVAMKDNYPIMGDDFMHLGRIKTGSRHTINKIVEKAQKAVRDEQEEELSKREKQQFLDWFDLSIRSGEPLEKGAEGVRMMSRTMLYADYAEIKSKIEFKHTYTDDTGVTRDRRVYVVSGTCGGTGSGTVLDMLYLIQEVLADAHQSNAEDPDLSLLLIMPQGWIKGIKNTKDPLYIPYQTNPFALFDEINGCLKDYNSYYSEDDAVKDEDGNIISISNITDENAGKRYYHYRCCGNDTDPFKFTVFQNAYLFDSVDSKTGEVLSPRQRSANVSNFLFVMEASEQAQAGLNTVVSNRSRVCKFKSRTKPFIEGFSASGIFIAQTWEELTRKYVHDKSLYQMLKYGFLGEEGSYDQGVFAGDKSDFNKEITNLINGVDYSTDLDTILQNLEGDDLEKVYNNIKDSIGYKNNRVYDIFAGSNKSDEKQRLSETLDGLLNSVRNHVYESCANWMITYNLFHALQLAKALDHFYEDEFKTKGDGIAADEMDIAWYNKGKDKKRRVCCANLFKKYIEYLVYRNLSNENDGYLDKCKEYLEAAQKTIRLDQIKLEGVKISEIGDQYKSYLIELKHDTNRKIYPDLNELFNFDTATFVANNEVEKKYAKLIMQTQDGLPDFRIKVMKGNEEQTNLLYKYKESLVRDLKERDTTWEHLFMMNDDMNSATFSRNIKVAFDKFVKKAASVSDVLSRDNTLKIQLKIADVDEQERLFEQMDAFRKISLSIIDKDENPHTSIVVCDFKNHSWLSTKMFPEENGNAKYDHMEKIKIPSTDTTDRIVLLFVRFGYALNEYNYYNLYKKQYEYIVKHPKERVNPTYNDIRFWGAKGDIGGYFKSIKEEYDKNVLIKHWKGHYDDFLKFTSLFLYHLLDSCYKNEDKTGLELLEKLNRDSFLKLELKSSAKKKTGSKKKNVQADEGEEVEQYKEIVLFKTEDLVFSEEKRLYKPEATGLHIEFGNKYEKITELRPTAPFFSFWYDILCRLTIENEYYIETFQKVKGLMDEYSSNSKQFLKDNIYDKYQKVDDQTQAERIDWRSIFMDFLKLCKK